MRIFLNTCGYSRQDPAHEYRWKSLTADPAIDALDELNRPRFAGFSLGALIEPDSRTPSVVLARDGEQVLLLASRLKSATRTGSQGDPAYSSLLIAGRQHNLPLLRRLAANVIASIPPQPNDFLAGTVENLPANLLERLLDQHVRFDDQNGFTFDEVDWRSELEIAADEFDAFVALPQARFRWRPRTGHNCFKLRQELAYELSRFTLPSASGVIAVVTGMKDPIVARRTEAWRSLSLMTEGISWLTLDVPRAVVRRHDRAEAAATGDPPPGFREEIQAITEAIGFGETVAKG
jgi:hypothetical protein